MAAAFGSLHANLSPGNFLSNHKEDLIEISLVPNKCTTRDIEEAKFLVIELFYYIFLTWI